MFNVNDKDEWNFASDEKQPKRTARHMIDASRCHAAPPPTRPPLPHAHPHTPHPPLARRPLLRYSAALGDISAYTLPRTLTRTREGSDGRGNIVTPEGGG